MNQPTQEAKPKKTRTIDLNKALNRITENLSKEMSRQLECLSDQLREDTRQQMQQLEARLGRAAAPSVVTVPLPEGEAGEARILNDQGVNMFYMGDLHEAVKYLEQAVEMDPNLAEAWNNLAMAYSAQAQTEKAVATFQKAIELSPDRGELLNNQGVLQLLQSNPEEALATLERAEQNNPRHIPLLLNLAQAYAALGQFTSAVRAWQLVTAIDPAHEEANQNLKQFFQ